MTLTFDPSKYNELLIKYQPRLIRTEEENEHALEVIEALMHSPERTPEEDELYSLLIVLIEKFEQEFYQPGLVATSQSVLRFLMDQQGLETSDLLEVFGSEQVIVDVMGGSCELTVSQVKSLGDLFGVSPSVFL